MLFSFGFCLSLSARAFLSCEKNEVRRSVPQGKNARADKRPPYFAPCVARLSKLKGGKQKIWELCGRVTKVDLMKNVWDWLRNNSSAITASATILGFAFAMGYYYERSHFELEGYKLQLRIDSLRTELRKCCP
jgi:hypothetical protein